VARHADSSGWTVTGLTRSPITGPAGNVEFLLRLQFASGQAAFPLDAAIGQSLEQGKGHGRTLLFMPLLER
jgi:hypothetical protein